MNADSLRINILHPFTKTKDMKKTIILCGLIGGFIASAWMLFLILAYGDSHPIMENGMFYGYAMMLLAFSLIFVAIRNYRDKHNDGMVSFGKAFRIGLFITLIASTVYVAIWLVEYFYFVPDFADKYADHYLDKMKANGATQAAIAEQTAQFAQFRKMYKNPFYNAMLTYAEILPVGLLVSLIAALVLKRKQRISVAV